MERLFNRYIDNQNKLSNLKDAYLRQGLVNQEILGEMVSISQLQRKLFEENGNILNDTVYYYRNNQDLIDDKIFKELQGFGNKLALLLNQKDTAIAYEIHEMLLDYAFKVNNPNYIVQEAYYKATVMLYLDGQLFLDETRKTYQIVNNYKDMYFKLDKESRKLFNRAYGNVFVTYALSEWKEYKEIFKVLEGILEFWRSETIQLNDLDFPFYRWIFLMKNNSLDFISTETFDKGVEKEYVDFILEAADEVYSHAKTLVKDTALPVEGLCEYNYFAAHYYAGHITLDELLKKIEILTYPLPENRYSFESRTRTIQIGAYYIKFLAKIEDKVLSHKLIEETINRIKIYISEMPFSNNERQISSDIETFIDVIADKVDKKEAFNIILELTVYCHFPTYVHITMVSNISDTILRYAVDNCPEHFIGMEGIEKIEDVYTKRHVLEDIIHNASLLHDVGKFYCLDYIGNFGRKLTDREFSIIKSHPERGYTLLKKAKIDDKYIEAALCHHLYYDGTKGYPGKIKENLKTKPIIDIITLADAIDAATDTLGRPYAKGKTLDDLMAEFEAGSGTRYSPILVELLKNPDLNKELKRLITMEREHISVRTHKNFTQR